MVNDPPAVKRRSRFKVPGLNIEKWLLRIGFQVIDPPSEGSTHVKDCLLEFREHNNTSADFVPLYEEMLPYAQTLELIKLHQEFIFSKLVSGLQMEARFSLQPILRLIAALSGDLMEDFIPFLPQIVNSLVILLNNGAQKDREIIDQIFISWSRIVYTLRFILRRDIEATLRDTMELRYYPNDIVSEKASTPISALVKLAGRRQLTKGIKWILLDIAERPERAIRLGLLYDAMITAQQKYYK